MLYFILFFIIVYIYYIIFDTPFFISNKILNFTIFKTINLDYIVNYKNNNYLYNFTLPHEEYDAKLISNYLKTNKLKMKQNPILNISDYKLNYNHNIVNEFLSLNKNTYDSKFSNFINTISYLICDICMKQQKSLNVGIIVNNRTDNNFQKGNFITFAFFRVYPYQELYKIMKNMNKSIINAKNKEKKYFSLYDLYNLYNCDLIFDSWRELTYIENIHGFSYSRIENNILSYNELKKIIYAKRKKFIYLDYKDNNYIISKCTYF